MARNLPSWNFALSKGWSTNFNPRSVVNVGLGTATNIHHYEEFRSVGKTYGTSVKSPDLDGTVESLHYAELVTPDQVRQRVILAVANGALRTYTSSTAWATPDLPFGNTLTSEAMGGAEMFNRLHLSSENQHGLPTGGLKFDGIRATNWGVEAPGAAQNTLESFDDNTAWTAGTDSVLADDTRTQDGGGSTKLTKTGTAGDLFSLSQNAVNIDVSSVGQDGGYLYVYVSPGTIQKLVGTISTAQDSAAIGISVTGNSSGVYTDSAFFNFNVGDLVPGWNLLTWVWNSPTGTSGTGWTNATTIGSIKIVARTTASSVTVSGDQFLLIDQLYNVLEGAAVIADAASGAGPDGTYTGVVTFLTEYGHESNAGPASNSLTLVDNQIDWTAIPVSGDDQVIARRLYRDISGDGIYRFVTQIDDNVTQTYSDTTSDAGLDDTSQPPFAGDTVFDNSPPGRLIGVTEYKDRILGIDAANKRVLVLSDLRAPEAFRTVDRLVFEKELTALEIWEPGILIYGTDEVWFMQGDGGIEPLRVQPFGSHTMGANGFRSVKRVKGGGHVAIQEEKVSLILEPENNWLMNAAILDQWQALTTTDLENFHIVFDPRETRIMIFDSASNDVFVYQFGVAGDSAVTGDGPGVDPQDLRKGLWFKHELPSGHAVKDSAVIETTAEKPEVWYTAGNRVYGYDTATTTWADGAATESITTTVESQWIPMGSKEAPSGVERGEPRFLRIHQSGVAGAVVYTITVTLARDPNVDNTTPITISWSQTVTGNESLIVPVPTQGAGKGEWAKVKMVSTTDATPVITGLELFYVPRGVDFSGPRS